VTYARSFWIVTDWTWFGKQPVGPFASGNPVSVSGGRVISEAELSPTSTL